MSLSAELTRYEQALRSRFPDILDSRLPGATDAQVASLRESIAPLILPPEVEALYRWSAGVDAPIFGGYSLWAIDDLIEQRSFWLGEPFAYPPRWLVLFGSSGHEFGFVALPASSEEAVTSVWFGLHSDADIRRLYLSLFDFVSMCARLTEEGILGFDHGYPTLDGEGFGDLGAEAIRAELNPGTFSWETAHPGTRIDRFTADEWPAEWGEFTVSTATAS